MIYKYIKNRRLEEILSRYIDHYVNNTGYQRKYIAFVFKGFISTLIILFIYAIVFLAIGFMYGVIIMVLTLIILSSVLILFKTYAKIHVICNMYLGITFVALLISIIYTGGISSPIIPWIMCIPFYASFILRSIEIWAWIGLTVFSISTLNYLNYKGMEINVINDNQHYLLLFVLINIGLFITLSLFTYISWNYIYSKESNKLEKEVVFINRSEIDYFIVNWNFVKSKLNDRFPDTINGIDQLYFLTDHEKKYALMDYLKLDIDHVADRLSVSKRTVETNLYRVRNKMKKNDIIPNKFYSTI